jgi:uncharacterized circularly permuted ATP-grasp superfamily protein
VAYFGDVTEIATGPGTPAGETAAAFAAGAYDEGRGPDGAPRGPYGTLFDHLDGPALDDAAGWMQVDLGERGVVFGGADAHPFAIDAVPRLIEAEEWETIERGLIQRVRALNAFLADAYGQRRIVAEGRMPARLIDDADWYEPAMAAPGAPPVVAHVAGPDLVRGPDGRFRVLEDNLRAPSGFAYLLAAREAIAPLMLASGLRPRGLEDGLKALAEALGSAAPAGVEEPSIVLLNDGPDASTWFEHRELAARLGLRIATAEQLARDGAALVLADRDGDAPERVDVIYRRVDDERLTDRAGALTPLGELLLAPLRSRALGCVNSPGSGVGDDKAVHTYVEAMIGFYLGEEPILPSVPGYDLGDPEQLSRALPRLGELVLKPRSEFGGIGVFIGPLASAAERRAAVAMVAAEPERYVAQEPVALSVHPTVVGGALRSRHVDLRPFVFSAGEEVRVVPGGLTRFAREEGEMVVNSGRGGGAKDTWVLPPQREDGRR